jgi:hypothetical protein
MQTDRKHKDTGAIRRNATRKNGLAKEHYVHVISPATASEIRKTLRIRRSQVRNILRAFNAVGVKV